MIIRITCIRRGLTVITSVFAFDNSSHHIDPMRYVCSWNFCKSTSLHRQDRTPIINAQVFIHHFPSLLRWVQWVLMNFFLLSSCWVTKFVNFNHSLKTFTKHILEKSNLINHRGGTSTSTTTIYWSKLYEETSNVQQTDTTTVERCIRKQKTKRKIMLHMSSSWLRKWRRCT